MTEPFYCLSEFERFTGNAAYGDKVYGSRKIDTSIMRMPNVIEGFDYAQAFNFLVDRYGKSVNVRRALNQDSLWRLADEYDYIIYTAPRNAIAPAWVKHPFEIAWASSRPPIDWSEEKVAVTNFIVYNPDKTYPWSRTARIEDSWYTEYVVLPKYSVPDLRQIEKIQDGEEWAVPDNVMLAGRYGRWKAGVLASDAYWDTVQRMREQVGE
jgi:hypothetical protein